MARALTLLVALAVLALGVVVSRQAESSGVRSSASTAWVAADSGLSEQRRVADSGLSEQRRVADSGPSGRRRVAVRRARQDRSSELDRWRDLIAEYVRATSQRGAGVPLSVLLLPVPLPAQRFTTPGRTSVERDSSSSVVVADESPGGDERRARPSAAQYAPSSPAPFQAPRDRSGDAAPLLATVDPATTEYLVQLFREQRPRDPTLPPMLLPQSAPRADPPPAPRGPPQEEPTLQPPSFQRSLLIRGELTVHRADYSEPYVAWYDATSGSSRVDLHGGTATLYRMIGADNTVQRAQAVVDRAGEGEVLRCAVMDAQPASPADRAPPALPDMQLFAFGGYEDAASGPLERWVHTLSGQSGELGASPGESLVFHHQMLVARDSKGNAVPVRYMVRVDSSALGPDCDSYEHRYVEVLEQQPDSKYLAFDIGAACGAVQSGARLEAVDPLREFTATHRDQRYDKEIAEYVKTYSRVYADGTEAAMRKNLLMQNIRFVESANRQGGPAALAANFLSDRLEAELAELLGVQFGANALEPADFPYSRAETRALHAQLPRAFDWRDRGAVTNVRYQGNCPACWAFAIVAALEGALFLRTGRLVPLSDKCLLDCGHTPGDSKCKPTWLDGPYAHVQSRGIVAHAEYPPYRPMVEQCRERYYEPVTFISGYVNVTSHSVPALKVAIRRHGPNVVLVDGKCKSFQFYKKGVLLDHRCVKQLKKLNHAAAAVGWGQKRGETHFVLKNSWAASYGAGGYVRVHGESNTCGVLAQPTYPRLEPHDVHRLPAAAELPPPEQDGGMQL